MAEYLTKESLEKGQKLMDIVEEALKNKGFAVNAIEINESYIVRSDGQKSWRKVTSRTFYLEISENEPASEDKDDPCNKPVTVRIDIAEAREIAKIGSNKIKKDE